MGPRKSLVTADAEAVGFNRLDCPDCGSENWHNAYLCKECGFPYRDTWLDHIIKGYLKPSTKRGKERAAAAFAGKLKAKKKKASTISSTDRRHRWSSYPSR